MNCKEYKTSEINNFKKKLKSAFKVVEKEGKRHLRYYLWYNDQLVLNTSLSRNNVLNINWMGNDFKLRFSQMKGLIECPFSIAEYLIVLKEKGVIK